MIYNKNTIVSNPTVVNI